MSSISQEEENFVRQSMLLTCIAPRAVRVLFNREFPPPLNQFVTKNKIKLQDLSNKRVINSAQWTILNAANPVSTDMDVTLMMCLIQNFSSISRSYTGFDNLPVQGDKSECADLARIKCYRNKMAHMDDNKISHGDHMIQWTEVSEAVGRLGGSNFVIECQTLLSSKLDQSNQEIMTEIKKSQAEIKILYEEKQYIIPKNTIAVMESIKKDNKDKLERFVVTQSAKTVLETLKKEQCVVIIGEPGSGKSATAYYVAFYLEDHETFQILPVTHPSDIVNFTIPDTNQLFLFDDVIGRYTLRENDANEWERLYNNLQKHLKIAKNIKILMTCRSNIYESISNKTLGLLSVCCDLSSDKMCLSLLERKQIAQSYITRDCFNQLPDDMILMFPFFSFICQMHENNTDNLVKFFEDPKNYMELELAKLIEKSDPAYICLALLVIFDNCVSKAIFATDNNDYKDVFEDLFNESKFKHFPAKATLLSSMTYLTKTYLKEINNSFCTVHDTLFDIISFVVGKNFKHCIIKHGCSSFIKDRIKFSFFDDGKNPLTILLDTSEKEAYFNRLINDIENGEYWTVFGNCQTNVSEYRKQFIEFINTTYKSGIAFCQSEQNKTTALHVSALLGYEDFCLMILKCSEININLTDNQLCTPLHCSSFRGHTSVTKLLLTYKAYVNQQEEDGWTPLKLACQEDHKDVVEVLLTHKADVDKADHNGETPLYTACKDGNKYIVELLLAYQADVSRGDSEGRTSLHVACSIGYKDIAELLLTYKANVNQQEEDGWTPLHFACQNGHRDIADLLLTHQADADSVDNNGKTPLHTSCKGGHRNIAELLLKYNANVDQRDEDGWTPLKLACLDGNRDIVEVLLTHQADVNMTSNAGSTPLHTACSEGYKDIAELLLTFKANVNHQEEDGCTPLHFACQNGNKDIVELLLTHQADVNKVDNKRSTALHLTCSDGQKCIVQLLLKHKANINQRDEDGWTPLKLACLDDHKDIVEVLLAHQADVNMTSNGGLTPLHTTCIHGYKDITELLLTFKANVNHQGEDGCTPLHWACLNGHKDIVELLLTHQADVNKVDNKRSTALHLTCSDGQKCIVRLLLKHKANINQRDEDGWTPLKLACLYGHTDVVEHLLTHKANINKADNSGSTPLHTSCSEGYGDIAELLLKYNADVNKRNKDGYTPQKLACLNGHKDVVELLINFRADIKK